MILTNGEYKGDFPPSATICGYNVFYRVIDINYLYKISEQSRVPIELDFENFEGEQFEIPCLSATTDNPDYKAYIAIIPGTCLAKLYERYGARLLEQNVRSFLQFTGKINKGIRDTIKTEPHMFLAFNNGIAATADHLELDKTNRYVRKISNLQIVNGGQTTASIYNTTKKDKADISNIFVQVKFSIIEKPEQYSEIVSRISRYANTQNKVNDADFSANNPALIAFEKLSRYILLPVMAQNNIMVDWDRRKRVLEDWKWKVMDDVLQGKKPLDDRITCVVFGCAHAHVALVRRFWRIFFIFTLIRSIVGLKVVSH